MDNGVAKVEKMLNLLGETGGRMTFPRGMLRGTGRCGAEL